MWAHYHHKCGKCRRFCEKIMGQAPSTEDVSPKFLLASTTATLEKSYPSAQSWHRLLDLIPIDELHSLVKVSPPSSLLAHRMPHKFRFFSLKVDDAGDFSWSILGMRLQKGSLFLTNSWKQRSACTPLCAFTSAPRIAKPKLTVCV